MVHFGLVGARLGPSPGRYLVSATIQNTFTNTDYDVKCTPGEVYVKENETLEVTVTVLEKGKNSLQIKSQAYFDEY